MSGWLHDCALPNDPVLVQGPSGSCFYVHGRPEQPLLLAGTGTGLAPLYGIVRDALDNGHTGPIHVVHGARTPRGLYFRDEMEELAAQHDNVSYSACAGDGDAPGVVTGPMETVMLAAVPKKLTGWRAYLCGNPTIVAALRKRLFLAGIGMREILGDAFVAATGG
jgi:CDP-4-dehydro-6-deoxyglucose reductase, E3